MSESTTPLLNTGFVGTTGGGVPASGMMIYPEGNELGTSLLVLNAWFPLALYSVISILLPLTFSTHATWPAKLSAPLCPASQKAIEFLTGVLETFQPASFATGRRTASFQYVAFPNRFPLILDGNIFVIFKPDNFLVFQPTYDTHSHLYQPQGSAI